MDNDMTKRERSVVLSERGAVLPKRSAVLPERGALLPERDAVLPGRSAAMPDQRVAVLDEALGIEAYHFAGIMQRFPNHFHEHYVIGFVAGGRRRLTCNERVYKIEAGDMVLFQPLQNHACEQIDEEALDWRCLNVSRETMAGIVAEITGEQYLPVFSETVVHKCEMVPGLRELHEQILAGQRELEKEERFYFFMAQLLAEYALGTARTEVPLRAELQAACDYMETNYMEAVSLDDLSRVSGLNKYTLLRYFTMRRGITPYQYLSTIRVNKVKGFLEAGMPLAEAALGAGFSDQSHLTRFFKSFIGVTPKVYQNMFDGTAEHRRREL